MEIKICDICKEQESELKILRITRLTYGEKWNGKPKLKKDICNNCLDKIFNTPQNN